MAIITIPLFSPIILPKNLQYQGLPILQHPARRNRTCCRVSDAELAADFASQVSRVKAHSSLRKEAMRKSMDLLFGDFCEYLGLEGEVVARTWRGLEEDEKLDRIRGFVDEWGASFHPLSLKSVKEMVEEHIAGQAQSGVPTTFVRFPIMKALMRFQEAEKK